jgi:hypothetical protein
MMIGPFLALLSPFAGKHGMYNLHAALYYLYVVVQQIRLLK